MNTKQIEKMYPLQLKKILRNARRKKLDNDTISKVQKQLEKLENDDNTFINITMSPYYKILARYFILKGIYDPTWADVYEAYHEMAKMDNKVNMEKRNE